MTNAMKNHMAGAGGRGFTLIELLIVIGLLGALATLVLSGLGASRTEAFNDALVQKELSDIQQAFQRFVLDCAPVRSDYALIAKYGLAPLMDPGHGGYLETGDAWSFDDTWNNARGRGWRGPYLEREGETAIDVTMAANDIPMVLGQVEAATGGTEVPVVQTPYVNDQDSQQGGEYYRIIPEFDAATGTVTQLWVVFPSESGAFTFTPTYATGVTESDLASFAYKRRLVMGS